MFENKIILNITIALILIFVITMPTYTFWNFVIANMFSFNQISFWQAFIVSVVIFVIVKIIKSI